MEEIKGDLDFKDVYFQYPARPEVPVLRGLNLHINAGQNVAIVGISGSGKSTIVSLIERFYEVSRGEIRVDNKSISRLNLKDYRKHVALVSQEPTLYCGSIRENILLGASEDVTHEEVKEVCCKAHIHDFISSLPEGYDTEIGAKGVQLSGGQKQRIAIAWALVRNPKILLLDEATSALDSSSERDVQEALEKAARGRTTIIIAHRLSTIRQADVIYVIQDGVMYVAHQRLV